MEKIIYVNIMKSSMSKLLKNFWQILGQNLSYEYSGLLLA